MPATGYFGLSASRIVCTRSGSNGGGSMPERSTCNSWPTVLLRVPQPRFIASVNSSKAMLASRIGTPTSRPSPTASPTSLCSRREVGRVVWAGQEPLAEPVEGAHSARRTASRKSTVSTVVHQFECNRL